MIPIIVGPQGPGYENIYIDSENNIVQVTTPPSSTGIPIGQLICYTGPTGIQGLPGYPGIITGATATTDITGPTGISITSVQYNPVDCELQIIYNNGTNYTSEPLECKKVPQPVTGATGPTGTSVQYIILYCGTGNRIQTVYTDNSYICANVCCVCPPNTGYTGLQGIISEYGATGPSGLDGDVSDYGATGPTGPVSVLPDISISIQGPEGPEGPYDFLSLAQISLDEPIQFSVSTIGCLKRNHVVAYQRAEILFPNTPLNVHWNISSTDNSKFTVLSNGLLINQDLFIRVRMSWTSNSKYIKPFAILDNGGEPNNFPILIGSSYPTITTLDDMVCTVQTGDIIKILPGTYVRYPVSNNQTFFMDFDSIQLDIVSILTI